jgi:hypothetical protein
VQLLVWILAQTIGCNPQRAGESAPQGREEVQRRDKNEGRYFPSSSRFTENGFIALTNLALSRRWR